MSSDDEALVRGRAYLHAIGAAWSKKLPEDRLLGIYLGRKWLGYFRLAVAAAPAGGRAAFEVTIGIESKLPGFSTCAAVMSLSRDLELASYSSVNLSSNERLTLTMRDGRWEKRKYSIGTGTETAGDLAPGTMWVMWVPNFWPLYKIPGAEDLALMCYDSGTDTTTRRTWRILPRPPPRPGDDPSVAATCLEIQSDNKSCWRWLIGKEGRAVELQAVLTSGGLLRLRPVSIAEFGKDLDWPPPMPEPAWAVLRFCRAIIHKDMNVARAALDVEGLLDHKVAGWNETDPTTMQLALELLGLAWLLQDAPDSDQTPARTVFDDDALLEGLLWKQIQCTEHDGLAEVRMLGTTWRLRRAVEGDRAGQWLIYDFQRPESK